MKYLGVVDIGFSGDGQEAKAGGESVAGFARLRNRRRRKMLRGQFRSRPGRSAPSRPRNDGTDGAGSSAIGPCRAGTPRQPGPPRGSRGRRRSEAAACRARHSPCTGSRAARPRVARNWCQVQGGTVTRSRAPTARTSWPTRQCPRPRRISTPCMCSWRSSVENPPGATSK